MPDEGLSDPLAPGEAIKEIKGIFDVAIEFGISRSFEFPGGVGGVVDNVNRWRDQIGLPKQTEDEIMSAMGRTEAPVGSFMTCTLLGEDRLVLGAILALGDKSLVVTVKGPRASLDSVQGPFTTFLESIGPKK